MNEFYFDSPHKQITENIRATVVKVIDGDTIRVDWIERDFDFPVRIEGINAPEMNEDRGEISRDFLANIILEKEVDIIIDPKNRVEKWGRLLGRIEVQGIDIGALLIRNGFATTFEAKDEGKILSLDRLFPKEKDG